MNVSQQADAAFMESLKTENRERYARLVKNIRRDSPLAAMDESQALTNFKLGLPTGGFSFAVYKRSAILEEALRHGTTEDYVSAILSVAHSDGDGYVAQESAPEIETVRAGSPEPRSQGGRPRLNSRQRREAKESRRDYMRRLMAERRMKPAA